MRKLLTVVICCYNSTSTIVQTLNSIDLVSNKDVDVFVIDDGSKDNLRSTIKTFLDRYPKNIQYFRKENGNWGSCVNFAIQKADSCYLTILDSDDTYNIGSFNYVLAQLRTIGFNTDLVLCNYVWKFLSKEKHNTKEINFSKTNLPYQAIDINNLGLYHVVTIHSSIFNLNLLKKVKPLPINTYFSDGVLIYQCLMNARSLAYINKDVHWYNYCIRSGSGQSISAKNTVKHYKNLETVFDAFLNAPFPAQPTKKQIQIARKFICNHFYWFYLALSKNYNYTHKEKMLLLKKYWHQLKQFESSHNIKMITWIAKFFNTFKGIMLPVINFATQCIPSSFLKASRYTRQEKKEAKAQAKAARKAI